MMLHLYANQTTFAMASIVKRWGVHLMKSVLMIGRCAKLENAWILAK